MSPLTVGFEHTLIAFLIHLHIPHTLSSRTYPAPQVNLHEVRITFAMVAYMLKQGYRSGQIVVLTPYLGQLLEIHKELRNLNQQVTHII